MRPRDKTYDLDEPVIRVRDLHIAFGGHPVLDGFDLTLYRREDLAVLGKSGSGKSVLIKCIIGLLQPDSGSIEVLGNVVSDLEHQALDRVRARVGFLFQSNALYDSMTVRENLEFPLRRHWVRLTPAEAEDRVMEALGNVGLAETVDMMPSELSCGMRKRVALARTLILRPAIILYDEPTTGLDPITSREIGDLMVEISEKYRTSSIIISHDMNCVERTSENVAVLLRGKCHALGSVEELRRLDDPEVRRFFE